ncbi:hypothetical protein HKW97_23910 (plasmid) [Pseudomonas luteola]|uniref:hypothetical protein n=1 Tax=Pseudomonas luteola TaxID=47886 RepID=UPI0038903F88
MKLDDAIIEISKSKDDQEAIFAKRPWDPNSEATIAYLNEELGVPSDLKSEGYDYFLEKPLVVNFLEAKFERDMDDKSFVDFVIHYAVNDAFSD